MRAPRYDLRSGRLRHAGTDPAGDGARRLFRDGRLPRQRRRQRQTARAASGGLRLRRNRDRRAPSNAPDTLGRCASVDTVSAALGDVAASGAGSPFAAAGARCLPGGLRRPPQRVVRHVGRVRGGRQRFRGTQRRRWLRRHRRRSGLNVPLRAPKARRGRGRGRLRSHRPERRANARDRYVHALGLQDARGDGGHDSAGPRYRAERIRVRIRQGEPGLSARAQALGRNVRRARDAPAPRTAAGGGARGHGDR
jgi:hypothetical protein